MPPATKSAAAAAVSSPVAAVRYLVLSGASCFVHSCYSSVPVEREHAERNKQKKKIAKIAKTTPKTIQKSRPEKSACPCILVEKIGTFFDPKIMKNHEKSRKIIKIRAKTMENQQKCSKKILSRCRKVGEILQVRLRGQKCPAPPSKNCTYLSKKRGFFGANLY